jgi:hypothetical protein
MENSETKQIIDLFLQQCDEMYNVAKTANRNGKSLSGSNFYGNKFHELLVEVSQSEINIHRLLVAADLDSFIDKKFSPYIEIVKSFECSSVRRQAAIRQLRMFCRSELLPRVENLRANPIPATEQVLPMAVVQNTRGYVEKIVLQANGCYEHEWYDACAVMIRRLIETLIIELYEAKGKAADIQDNDGNFFMLSVLVDKVLAEKSWNLGRESKTTLPFVKSLGDRSAHNRYYLAKKGDIDKVLSGLRVVSDNLLHLSGLK